jgi:hypothetical protein
MTSNKHLQDKQYYEDLYDKLTIRECLSWTERILDKELLEELKLKPKKEQDQFLSYLVGLPLSLIKGERYLARENTIKEWMEEDRQRDNFISSHPAPTAYCPKCSERMESVFDDLDWTPKNTNLRILHLYRCEACNEKKGLYSDGEPFVFEDDFCPKCHKKWKPKYTKTKTKLKIKNTCSSCGYKEEDVIELTTKPKETDPYFEEDRKEYCLSKEEGEKYRHWKEVGEPRLRHLLETIEDQEKHKDVYEKANNIKMLTISEISDLLAKELAKANFKGLVITDTKVSRDLIISFSVQDTKNGRNEVNSRNALKKALAKILQDTNWKLMSDGIRYKLGLLSGRLRGIDNKEALFTELKEETDNPN